jgi:hypothetical protein
MTPEFKAALRGVDWLRVAHRLATLGRALRGDARDLEADHLAEQSRAGKLRKSIEGVARDVRREANQ